MRALASTLGLGPKPTRSAVRKLEGSQVHRITVSSLPLFFFSPPPPPLSFFISLRAKLAPTDEPGHYPEPKNAQSIQVGTSECGMQIQAAASKRQINTSQPRRAPRLKQSCLQLAVTLHTEPLSSPGGSTGGSYNQTPPVQPALSLSLSLCLCLRGS